jgi:hypothetical protein
VDAKQIQRSLAKWTQDMDSVSTELTEVISDLHVHVGPGARQPGGEPLFSLLLLSGHVEHWRVWLTGSYEDDFAERKGFSGPNPERWLWWKVYAGDIAHEGELRAALAKYHDAVEAWARPHLLTQET